MMDDDGSFGGASGQQQAQEGFSSTYRILASQGYADLAQEYCCAVEAPQRGECMTIDYPPGHDDATTWIFEVGQQRVQHYVRPDAGQDVGLEHVRPPQVLRSTMVYLTDRILRNPEPSWDARSFDKFEYLLDRFRKVCQDYRKQGVHSDEHRCWLEFMVRVLALRLPACSRSPDDAARAVRAKKAFSERLGDLFDDLLVYYRERRSAEDADLLSAVALYHGLKLNSKIEDRTEWCLSSAAGDCEASRDCVNITAAYQALHEEVIGTAVVQNALSILHALHDGHWFRFFLLCRTLPLTTLQRCLVYAVFTYVRFRAVVELCCVHPHLQRARVRGFIPIPALASWLMFATHEHCELFLQNLDIPIAAREGGHMLASAQVAEQSGAAPLCIADLLGRLSAEGLKERLALPSSAAFLSFHDIPIEGGDELGMNDDAPLDLMHFLDKYYPKQFTEGEEVGESAVEGDFLQRRGVSITRCRRGGKGGGK